MKQCVLEIGPGSCSKAGTDLGQIKARKLLPFVAWRLPQRKQPSNKRFIPDLKWPTGLFISRETRTMRNNDQDKQPVGIPLHLAAIMGGIVMMVLGVGLSVTMVLLPIGIPLGLIGLGVFIWGLTPGMRR